ncbi:hypothetical protein F4780DRAFT_481622 [Xylariomycetidae sp. FL0641]|nr:hypothetical protein F4780DRAFT_481622 [Xylariomycetidae sp. FL0641]
MSTPDARLPEAAFTVQRGQGGQSGQAGAGRGAGQASDDSTERHGVPRHASGSTIALGRFPGGASRAHEDEDVVPKLTLARIMDPAVHQATHLSKVSIKSTSRMSWMSWHSSPSPPAQIGGPDNDMPSAQARPDTHAMPVSHSATLPCGARMSTAVGKEMEVEWQPKWKKSYRRTVPRPHECQTVWKQGAMLDWPFHASGNRLTISFDANFGIFLPVTPACRARDRWPAPLTINNSPAPLQ